MHLDDVEMNTVADIQVRIDEAMEATSGEVKRLIIIQVFLCGM